MLLSTFEALFSDGKGGDVGIWGRCCCSCMFYVHSCVRYGTVTPVFKCVQRWRGSSCFACPPFFFCEGVQGCRGVGNEVHRREGAGLPRILQSLVSTRRLPFSRLPYPLLLLFCGGGGDETGLTLSGIHLVNRYILCRDVLCSCALAGRPTRKEVEKEAGRTRKGVLHCV